jgi:diadenosine tetraphosphatase ApaH/serine/threonine PP2A family protein phosphatase
MSYRGPYFKIRLSDESDVFGEVHWTSPIESHHPVQDIETLYRLIQHSDPGRFILLRNGEDDAGRLFALSGIRSVQPHNPGPVNTFVKVQRP